MPHVILMALAPNFFVMALGFVAGRMRAIDVIRPLLAAAIVHVFPAPLEIARVSILLAAVPSGFSASCSPRTIACALRKWAPW